LHFVETTGVCLFNLSFFDARTLECS